MERNDIKGIIPVTLKGLNRRGRVNYNLIYDYWSTEEDEFKGTTISMGEEYTLNVIETIDEIDTLIRINVAKFK